MSWASPYILALRSQREVEFSPRGTSMEPIVKDNQRVRVGSLHLDEGLEPVVGSVVLCTVNGRQYLHLVKAINGDRYLIGNNRGGLNGWTNRKNLHGLLLFKYDVDGHVVACANRPWRRDGC